MRGPYGKRCGDGRPMGRRGQGQDRRLAVRARRYRRALPGRPQRRPHPGDRQRDVQARAPAIRRRAARQAQRHRQRRRPRSLAPDRGDGWPQEARHRYRPTAPQNRGECHPYPASASRARPIARGGGGRAADRHDGTRHRPGLRGQGRAAGHPRPGPQEPGHPGCQGRQASGASQRAAARAGRGRDRQGYADARARGDRAENPALRRCRLVAARSGAARRPAHPV